MGKIAFVFSGQGAQYVGMGKELAEQYEVAKNIFEKADKALELDVQGLCFNGPEEDLNRTENTQPAILTTSIAILEILKEKGLKADVYAGLSLGEYTAHVAAGTLEFEDAVRLVKKRGRYMQEAVPEGKGTMAAIIGLEEESVAEIIKKASVHGIIEGASYNCPGQIVVGGEVDAVKSSIKLAEEAGAKMAVQLKVSAPFHTSMLKPAADRLSEALESVELNDGAEPVISNVTADYIDSKESVKTLLIDQVKSSVLWEASVNKMIEDGVDTFIEIGPGKVLSGFIKKINRKLNIYNVENLKTLEKTLNKLEVEVC
jgi:[acyl-carrier-protein] S-malonyltransferase